jgi:beta-lactamase regulating signal transducer with metallopeptidase domain
MTMNWPGDADWLYLFVEYFIKTSLALSVALLLMPVLRRRPASTRHFVLSFFLIGLLLIPVFSEFRFGWETDLLPSPDSTVHELHSAVQAARSTAEPPTAGRPRSAAGAQSAAQPTDSALPPSEVTLLLSETDSARGIAGAYFPLLWSTGFAVLLLRLGIGILGAYRLTLKGENLADPIWRMMLARFLAVLGLKRRVRLKSHREVAVPFTWGFFRPVILFPAGHEQWTQDQRFSALVHEVSHIKRADFLVMLLVRVSRAAFWFNPLTWIVLCRLKKEQERACDELVLTTGIKPSAYAAALLSFKRSSEFRVTASPAFPGLLGGTSFNDRLSAILRERLTCREATMKTKLMLAIIVILSVAFIGSARPARTTSWDPPKREVSLTEAPVLWTAPTQPVGSAAANSNQEKKAEAQEKKKEEPRKIVVRNTTGKTIPIEVTIVEGDQSRTIRVGEAVTLKKGVEGELFLVTPEGKELKIQEGEPIRLTIKDKDLVLIREGKAFTLTKEGAVGLAAKQDAEGNFTLSVVPRVKVQEAGKGAAKAFTVVVPSGQAEEPAFVTIAVAPAAEIQKKLEELQAKLDQEKQIDVAEFRDAIRGIMTDLSGGQGKPAWILVAGDQTAEIKKKLEALQAKLDQTKPVDVNEIKEAIKEILADLAKQEAEDRVVLKTAEGSRDIYIVQGKEGSGQRWILRKADPDTLTLNAVTVKFGVDNAGMSMAYKLAPGKNSRAVYERIVERVKQEMPEGYKLEPEFNEKTGAITLKFTGTPAGVVSKEFLKKLAAIIKDEIK